MKYSKNILLFMRFCAPYPGNFIQSLIRLDQTAKKAGVKTVYVFSTDISNLDWVQDFMEDHKNVYFLSGNYLKDILTLQKILRQHQIRYVHTHFASARQHSLFKIARIFYPAKLFVIAHLHNHYTHDNLLKSIIKRLITHIDLYIGCSESVALEFKKTNKRDASKVTFVTNAIEFTRLDVVNELNTEDLQIPPSATKFLMFGFDYLRKGVDIVLDAMQSLSKKNPNICLLISLSRNREGLLRSIEDRYHGVPPWLRLVGAREDVGSYFQFSDCFISASREEGFCTALVEAAYSGIPIISSDIPGPDSLNIPHTYKFRSENVPELQRQMETVIALPDDEIKQITADQKAYAIKTFDLDDWANKIFAIYQGLN